MPVFQILEMVQCLFAVEQPDVSRLCRRQATHRPAQVNKVRLDRSVDRMHSDFTRQTVRLARIARAARGHDVRPLVRSATRQWNQVIARQ